MNDLVSLMDAAKMGRGATATSAHINDWTIYTMVLGGVISLFGSGDTKAFSGSISKHFLPLFQMQRHIPSLAVAGFHFCLDIVVLYLFLKYYKIAKLKELTLAGLTQ